MPDAKVDIFVVVTSGQFDVQEIIATLTTDGDGRFNTETAIQHGGVYEVSAVFRDTGETYLESSDVRNVTVGGPSEIFGDWKSPGWFSVMLGVPLAVLITIGAFLYYRHYRKTHPSESKQTDIQAVAPLPPSVPAQARISIFQSPVKITLPQISQPFPDVWGKGDDLLIVFTADGSRHSLVHASLEIDLGPESKSETELSPDGTASREHMYVTPGKYEIKATLSGGARNGYTPASRMVRIVDYREEIVRLYNEIVATLRSRA